MELELLICLHLFLLILEPDVVYFLKEDEDPFLCLSVFVVPFIGIFACLEELPFSNWFFIQRCFGLALLPRSIIWKRRLLKRILYLQRSLSFQRRLPIWLEWLFGWSLWILRLWRFALLLDRKDLNQIIFFQIIF